LEGVGLFMVFITARYLSKSRVDCGRVPGKLRRRGG
jgi:hypothetical protein